MKSNHKIASLLVLATLGCQLGVSNLHAAAITWAAPTTISGDTDVSTGGTLLGAYSFSTAAGNTTLNGVTFVPGGSGTGVGTFVQLSTAGTVYAGFGSGAAGTPYKVLSSGYQTLLGKGRYGVKNATVTLLGLTIGHQYQVQMWCNDSRAQGGGNAPVGSYVILNGFNSANLYLNSTTSTAGGVGQYSIGTFVADGANQTFALGSSWTDCYINAIQLRDQGAANFNTAGFWNGLNGAAWDASSTVNWSTNYSASALGSDTFSSAMALSSGTAYFPDNYFNSGSPVAVTQSNVTVASGGVSTTTVNFSGNTVNYAISAADSLGITGATVVNKTGASTLTFSNANTYNGNTTISAGTLRLADPNAVSNSTVTVSVANGLSFESGITSPVLGGLAGASGIVLTNRGGAAVTLQVGNNGGSTTYSGSLSGTGGALTKVGSGTLTLSGQESLTGPAIINDGNLRAEGPAADGVFPNAASVTVNSGATLTSGANGLFGYNNHPVPVTVNAGGTMTVDGGTGGGPNIFGTVTLSGGTVADGNSLHTTYGSYDFGGSTILATGATNSLFSARDFQLRNAVKVQVDSGSTLNVTGYFTPLAHSGNQTLTKTGPGLLILAGANTHGATVVSNGTLQVDGTLPAYAVTVATNATLTGSGTINGPTTIQNGGTLTLGVTNATTSTLTISSTLSLAGTVALKISKTGGSPASDTIQAMTGVTYGGTLTVTNITSDSTPLAVGDSFQMFNKYTGSYSGGFTTFNLPALPTGLSWDKSQLAVNGTIAVVNTTPTPVFNPPTGGYAGAQAVTISSATGSTIYYTTDGSDPMTSGTVQSGSSPVTVNVPANTNLMTLTAYAYTAISGNSSEASAQYSTVATPTWTSLYGGSWTTAGNWSNNVIASGARVTANFSQLTMTANQTLYLDGAENIGSMVFGDLGGAYNWDLETGSSGPLTLDNGTNSPTIAVLTNTATMGVVLAGSGGLTKTGNGTLVLNDNEGFTGGTVVNAGVLSVNAGGAAYNSSTLQGTLTVNSGAACWLNSANAFGWGGGGLTDVYLNRGALAGANSCIAYGISYHLSGGVITNTGSLRLGVQTGYPDITINSTSNSVTSVIAPGAGVQLNTTFGQSVFVVTTETGTTPGGVDLAVNSAISQAAGTCSIVKTGAGTLALNATNTYTGSTTVSNGTLLVNGALGAGTVTVTTNGTLAGIGTIGGVVTNNGTMAPGIASIGTLTVNNALTLAGVVQMEINTSLSQSNDVVKASSITYGGTLTVVNAGPAPVLGDSFQLFSVTGSHTANFTATNLPALGTGLTWNWNPATGTLSVVNSVNTTPTNLVFTVSGGTLTLSWPADHLGWHLQYQTNSLTDGLNTNWITIPGSDTMTSTNILIDPTKPTVFYRMTYP